MEFKDKSEQGESKGKSEEGGVASVLTVIPSIYYDLIARICPGLAFWVALFLPDDERISVRDLSAFAPSSIFLVVVFSYLSGIVLTAFSPIWDLVSLLCFKLLRKNTAEAVGLLEHARLSDQWQHVTKNMEDIAKTNDAAGRTVAKALAEVALCHNLLSGLLVLAAIGWSSGGKLFALGIHHSTYLIGIGASFLVASLFRQLMFLGRVKSLHTAYVDGGS
jgi:hypothetical protein